MEALRTSPALLSPLLWCVVTVLPIHCLLVSASYGGFTSSFILGVCTECVARTRSLSADLPLTDLSTPWKDTPSLTEQNDDGPPSSSSPNIFAFSKLLQEKLGWDVRVVVPDCQKSW